MNQITDDLWVSDIDSVRTRSTSQFDAVVSVCQDACRDNVGCRYDHFPLADDPHAVERWGGTTDYSVFADACDCVRDHLDVGHQTVVHCHAGQNRSVSVCTAVCGARRGLRYDDAFDLVRDARPIANPDQLMVSHAKRYIVSGDDD